MRVSLHFDALVEKIVVIPSTGRVHTHPRQCPQPFCATHKASEIRRRWVVGKDHLKGKGAENKA